MTYWMTSPSKFICRPLHALSSLLRISDGERREPAAAVCYAHQLVNRGCWNEPGRVRHGHSLYYLPIGTRIRRAYARGGPRAGEGALRARLATPNALHRGP